jgi:hypothetical protein
MMVFRDLLQLADVEVAGKLLKMEHRIVFAVFAKESHFVTEIHILQMVCDETPVASLYPFAELLQNFFIHIWL